ncbi:plasma membrane fusion protein PRM1 [Ephemerocybe angulata]|uniref:Plasma membrane fusion protein PRM1 n=1 Tax=Ephemerocybe angulata TaxID=980116 RepID=A0A8H6MCX9_9AGAR|nr:plasma membrane fusion protein PRM1 [Tulosesus angulatus]
MAFYSQQPPSYDDAASTLTPYLQLPHLLSLTWLAYPILSLIFVAFRLSSSLESTQNAIASAKGDLLTSCKAAEEAATAAASMPRYMALATNEQFADAVNASLRGARLALTLSLTAMEAIINFIIDLYRSVFLCFLELIVRGGLAILSGAVTEINNAVTAVTGGLKTSIQNEVSTLNGVITSTLGGLNKVNPFGDIPIPQIPIPNLDSLNNIKIPDTFQQNIDKLGDAIPTASEIKGKLETIINTPFELLKKDINDTFAGIEFNGTALPVPAQNRLSFCDNLNTGIIDDIGADILKAFKIGIVILIVIALLLIGLNCLLTWYKWRSMKAHLEYTRQAWMTDPTMIHAKGTSISSTPQITLSDHNLLMLHANTSHPLVTRITNQVSARLRLSPSQHTNFQWFFNYVFHPPAAACFLIGFFGLLLVQIQLAAMGPLVSKYHGQAADSARDFSVLIADSINKSMLNQSTEYARDVNARVDAIQSTINNGVFGWVNVTTTQINSTIAEFYDDLQNGVTKVFGNTILATPASEFVKCLIGSKVDAIENALTFLHDNLKVDMPRVNETVLLLSPQSVNEASAPIAAAALGDGSSGDNGLVGRLVNSYANSLKKERITFAIFLALWGVVVLMGLGVILWHSYGLPAFEQRRKRRYQREQRDNLPSSFDIKPRDPSMSPPEGRLVMTKEDKPWDGGMAASNDLPQFTPLPSPRRSTFKPFWTTRPESPAVENAVDYQAGNVNGSSVSLARSGEGKVSRFQALKTRVKSVSAPKDPETQKGEAGGSNGFFGKVKGVFAKKEAEPEPEFWQSYNDRPRLKIVVDTPSDRSFAERDEDEVVQRPIPNSRWSVSPTEPKIDFGWRSSKKNVALDSPNSSAATLTPSNVTRRLPPPPPGLRHKPSVPTDIGGSLDDPFLSSFTPTPPLNTGSRVSNPFNSGLPEPIIPSAYPVPLHSTSVHSSPSPRHNRTSSVPVWRVTNFSPSDQVSVNSSTASLSEMRKLPTAPKVVAQGSAQVVNPFITPFDDEHRVEIVMPSKGAARKSMATNPFVSPGTAF